MPYIKKEDRIKFNPLIEDIVDELTDLGYKKFNSGELNYVISSIVWKLFDITKNYETANSLCGVLDCVKTEFYRRKISEYEIEKIKENGDV